MNLPGFSIAGMMGLTNANFHRPPVNPVLSWKLIPS
jgi:hypothetical protein